VTHEDNDIEHSLEESTDSESGSFSALSSDLSSSEVSGSHDEISSQKLVVALETPRKMIIEKLAHAIRQPIPSNREQPIVEKPIVRRSFIGRPVVGRPFEEQPRTEQPIVEQPVDKKPIEIPPEDKEGIIFLSHLPYGFFEKQLKKFFKQFGALKKLNLIRSSKTGNSKGYAYIQYEDPIVAKIVCDTMDGYIMFSRVLKCQMVPPENYNHKKFWKIVTKPNIPPHILHANALLSPKTKKQEMSRIRRLTKKDQKRRKIIALAGLYYKVPKRKFITSFDSSSTEDTSTNEESQ
jgi:nucleolar protein 15